MIDNLELEKLKFRCEKESDIENTNTLNLAFIGDAVWTLMVRDFFCEKTNFKNNNLHKLTTKYVKATYQAKALEQIGELLTDFEKDLARRARNTKMNTTSKNASLAEYKKATGFEAILGYLYLSKNFDRIKLIFDILCKNFDLKGVIK